MGPGWVLGGCGTLGMWHPGDLPVPKACSRALMGRSGARWPCDPPPPSPGGWIMWGIFLS